MYNWSRYEGQSDISLEKKKRVQARELGVCDYDTPEY